ncbi:MAG TPA: HEAT repeat domain-containing protein [Tepidisphaeraceae bacterium]|jgi:hypothetical protein|nr:HEAT repeat domain-containing protein [Tepidisphaeraceae bacterium]
MATDIAQMIRNKDWSAVEASAKTGPPAVGIAEPFLNDKDEVVRLAAIDSIAAAGGPRAPELLMRMVGDKNEQVRINAINALHKRPPVGREDELIILWDQNKSRDGYVRQQIPMILAEMGAKDKMQALKARSVTDTRQEVDDGMTAGVAKLGDKDFRSKLGKKLELAHGTRIAEIMPFVDWIDEQWVIPMLLPVLKHREIALILATHILTVERRGCDLAVDAVLKISKANFSFKLDTVALYKDPQIAEVTRYVEAQARTVKP